MWNPNLVNVFKQQWSNQSILARVAAILVGPTNVWMLLKRSIRVIDKNLREVIATKINSTSSKRLSREVHRKSKQAQPDECQLSLGFLVAKRAVVIAHARNLTFVTIGWLISCCWCTSCFTLDPMPPPPPYSLQYWHESRWHSDNTYR